MHKAQLRSDEIKTKERVPVTTVPRTLLDLAAVLRRGELERAMERAEALRLADPLPLAALLDRYPRRAGTPALREILEAGRLCATATRSELEDRFLSLLDAHAFPRPEINAKLSVGGRSMEVDCLWRDRRLIVELDGRTYHDTAAAFERDRERDRLLQAAGWRVVRITWRQLAEESGAVVADLQRLLAPE